MKILDRYVTISLLRSTLLALAVLVGIFAFFALIDELEDSGKGRYGVVQALEHLLLTIPNLISELFPIAAAIGGMMTLGKMSSQNELAIIRTSGISQTQLIKILSKGILILILLAIIVSEFIAPFSEQAAEHRKSIAMTQQITLQTKYGFWSRNENNFVNIRKIISGNEVEGIYIYEFADNNILISSIYAKKAKYIDGKWQLENVNQSLISDDGIVSKPIELANWESVLKPEVLNLITIKPKFLTLWGLYSYINYLKENDQNSQVYEQAFWAKLAKPFTIFLMVIIAVPIIKIHSRQNNVGQRVFLGCLLGILFHMLNQVFGHLGVVYNIPAFASMIIPLFLLLSLVLGMLYKDNLNTLFNTKH